MLGPPRGEVLVIKDAQLLKDPERTDSSGMEVRSTGSFRIVSGVLSCE